MHVWGHFKTITRHRHIVRHLCFQVGLYWQGLTHDLSKYSPAEFCVGARYYTGTRSPNAVERQKLGYSTAWMHHKGRNKHHYEYWTDLCIPAKVYGPVPMPPRYLAEMVKDRVAACKVYLGTQYHDGAALDYFNTAHDTTLMHPETGEKLRYILTLLAQAGEQAMLAFVRDYVIPDRPYPPLAEKTLREAKKVEKCS